MSDNPYDHGRALYERGWFDATEKTQTEIAELKAEIERLRKTLKEAEENRLIKAGMRAEDDHD